MFRNTKWRGKAQAECSNRWVTWSAREIQNVTGARISWPATLAKKLASLSGNVGMSAEHLSWLFSGAEIERLATTLRQYFDAIEVIVYIRRQDKQAISHHQQGSRSPWVAGSLYYSGNCRALPYGRENYDEYLDYSSRLGLWRNSFSVEQITIRVFEPSFLKDGDPVADFLEILGLPCTSPL